MKIIFCPTMFPDIENDIKNSKNPLPVSGHKYQENLLKGIADNGQEITVLNIPRLRHYPDYPKMIFRKATFTLNGAKWGESIGFINLFGINYISQAISIYRSIKKELKTIDGEKCILLIFNTYLPQTLAARWIRHHRNVILCDAIGDLHGEYGLSYGHGMKGKLVDALGKWMDRMAEQFDGYVLLSKHMKEALKIQGKPYVIVEGFAPPSENRSDPVNIQSSLKTVFYAGAVRMEYGIGHLLQAFSLIEGDEYRLVIAGAGNAQEMVSAYAQKDPRIEYIGVVTPQEVSARQRVATVLVSPRLPNTQYVKYSFPSKTLECLASGRPYIAHRLPCEPTEYGEYIQYPDSESDEALKAKIIEICELSQEQRDAIGQRAREFVLEKKNPRVQCEKIVKMLEEISDREG